MDQNQKQACIVRVGDLGLELICPSPQYALSIGEYFMTAAEGPPAVISLVLEIEAAPATEPIPESLFTTKVISGNSFRIAGNLVEGDFDPLTGKGSLKVNHLITSDIRTRVFEQLLYQGYYSACQLSGYKSLLIHSCSVIKEGRGYLFAGESGSGKSTLARLSENYQVLNDEISMLHFSEQSVTLHSTPFNGHFKGKERGAAPLQAVFILAHGQDEHKITPLKKAQAARTLFKEIVPPLGLEEAMSSRTHAAMLEAAGELVSRVPVYRLDFLPDEGFWTQIDRITETYTQRSKE